MLTSNGFVIESRRSKARLRRRWDSIFWLIGEGSRMGGPMKRKNVARSESIVPGLPEIKVFALKKNRMLAPRKRPPDGSAAK